VAICVQTFVLTAESVVEYEQMKLHLKAGSRVQELAHYDTSWDDDARTVTLTTTIDRGIVWVA
jgi:hypothetical protein